MSQRFDLFRLSLLPHTDGELFDLSPNEISREDWLRRVFGEEFPFNYYGSEFYYQPSNSQPREAIVGKVGRHFTREENKPPSEGLEEFTHHGWRAAVLVLDPSAHDDGQKLGLQNMSDVGKPSGLVKEIISAINNKYPRGPYHIEVGQIIEEQSFWRFVDENREDITSMTLELITPNMWGGSDEVTTELKEYRDNEAARRVRVNLKNEDGLKPDTKRMRVAVNYATKSGGKVTAKTRKGKRYNSANSAKHSYLGDVLETGAELFKVAGKLVNRILGRE